MGPIKKDKATPNDPINVVTAVAVVLSFTGNQFEDKTGGAACVTGPANPLNNCPAAMDL